MSLMNDAGGSMTSPLRNSSATTIEQQENWTYNDDPAELVKLDPNITVVKKNGATYISPRVVNPSWIELKVGVLLPFHQHGNAWTRELTLSGTSAIRLAAQEINAQGIIPGAYITLVERDSYPKEVDGQEAITQAVFSTVSLIQEGVVGVIGDISSSWTSLSALMTSTLQIPQCSFTAVATSLSDKTQYGYFFRTVPTKLLFADAAFSFLVSQGWPRLGILYTNDDAGQQLSENLIVKSKTKGINIRAYQKFYEDGPSSDVAGAIRSLMDSGVQIVFLAAEGEAQTTALTLAASMGYVSNSTVWITTGAITNELYAAVQEFNSALQQQTLANANKKNNNNQTLSNMNALQHAVQTTKGLNMIDFNNTFAGGVFMFEPLLNLTGYPPYDAFQEKWSKLDPRAYPYGGRTDIESNQGMAYSCMMVMAHGFQQAVYNSTNATVALQKLSQNKMGDYLQPSTFNTSFVGPTGPMIFDQNGDVMLASFSVYNIQKGNEVKIGRYIAGDLTLTSPPIYHDGSSTPPSGVPTKVNLSARMDSPMSIVITCVAGLGTLLALIIMVIVIRYRKQKVFKASSPLFCVLELLGFILTYASVMFFIANRSKIDCLLIPTTFHLGFSLVLSNLIAKNYRIYRIFNNIFITRTVVTDLQLLKVSGSIAIIESIILLVWLCTSDSTVITIPVSHTAFYVGCSFKGPASSVCSLLLTIIAAGQLAFATFLAIKTRSVGKSYSKYSEYKQIGISVYNIFFSALIGFVIYSVPATDYYTRHYLTATTVTWATTFSLLVLFLPKLHAFFFGEKNSDASGGKHSDLSGRIRRTTAIPAPSPVSNELISLNRMISNPNTIDPALAVNQNMSLFSAAQEEQSGCHAGAAKHAVLEAHEARMPVQVTFKYFPFLAAWDMKQVFLFPKLGYFSFFSEKTQKGQVFSFTKATVVSATAEACIFRVHGTGLFDVLIQVANRQELEKWCAWFNSAGDSPLASFLTCSNGGTTQTDSSDSSSATRTLTVHEACMHHTKKQTDSRRHLLRQESEITLKSMDSCFHQPVVSTESYDRGHGAHASTTDHQRPPTAPPGPFFTSFTEFLDSDKPLQPNKPSI